ncbi:ribonuclease HI [Acuticoccus sp.]|uniref:ribonuclease HI n=1 Tax=Acuticoccus sp. TaxID=1904378 RepID=UPI003B51779D
MTDDDDAAHGNAADAEGLRAPKAPRIVIYTDGACSGNPGPGGWGAVLTFGTHEKELSGASPRTTNNRMELTAAIRALEALKRPSTVDVVTDSQYLRRGITEWLPQWKANGWRTAAKQPVKNDDLWRELSHLDAIHDVHWRWVKGHAGHVQNERADTLARRAIRDLAAARSPDP